MRVDYVVALTFFQFHLSYLTNCPRCYDGVVEAFSSPPARHIHHVRLSARWPDLPNFLGRTSEMDEMEKEVYATARAKLDMKRVVDSAALYDDIGVDGDSPLSSSAGASSLSNKSDDKLPTNDPKRVALLASPWQISLASASAVSAFVLATTSANLSVTGVVFLAVFVIANGDPLEEEGAAGALARLLGRLTIQSVESSKPKLKALARAAITSEEDITILQQRIQTLEEENAKLALWKKQRIAVEECLPKYTMDELKELARSKKIPLAGTKSQLLMRLVENQAIDIL